MFDLLLFETIHVVLKKCSGISSDLSCSEKFGISKTKDSLSKTKNKDKI